jgi:hypothetical protein
LNNILGVGLSPELVIVVLICKNAMSVFLLRYSILCLLTAVAFRQVEDYAEHPDYLDKINWYLLPSANPDG